jgi:hypothetical protein
MKTRIETVALGVAVAALAGVGALLAQDNSPAAPAPAQPPPAAGAPPAAAPPPSSAEAPAPTGPGENVDDEVFIPTQELNADDQVTFPVDI